MKIKQLAKYFSGPIFQPHVTLASSFVGSEKDLILKTENISKKIKPFKLSIDKIQISNIYFQSLFLKVKLSKSLINARQVTCENLNYDNSNYNPHLSLLYGEYKSSQKIKSNEINMYIQKS